MFMYIYINTNTYPLTRATGIVFRPPSKGGSAKSLYTKSQNKPERLILGCWVTRALSETVNWHTQQRKILTSKTKNMTNSEAPVICTGSVLPLTKFNPLNAELNPICHLQALLEAHHILHVSRIRVKRWVKSHLPFAGVIRSSPYSPR